MKQGLLTVALLSALPGAALAEPLQPTGKWVLNFDDAQCIASREYGTTDQPLYILLKPSPAGGIVQLLVARKGSTEKAAKQGPITISDGLSPPIRTSHLSWYEAKKSMLRLTSITLTLQQFDHLRRARQLSLKAPKEFSGEFALTHFDALMRQVDVCLADLKRVWNVVEPEVEGRSRPMLAEPGQFFKSEDYPLAAMQDRETGTVGLIILVDEKGAIRDCTVTETSGVAVLDAQSCAVVSKRAKYRPAVGSNGSPIKSWTNYRIRWALPDKRY